MAEVTGIWWQPFRVPLRRPLLTAHGSIPAREGLVIGIRTQADEGIGEIAPLPSFAGGTATECAAALPALAAALVGRDARDCWTWSPALDDAASPGSRAALGCGIETAIAALLSRESGLPLWCWLGSVAGLATDATTASIPVNALVDASDPAAAAGEALAAVAVGHETVKVKVGADAAADEERLAAVRQAAGGDVAIRIDANGAWGVEEAIARLTRYERYGVQLVEQPTSAARPDAIEALARVRSNTAIQVAADEACTGPAAARTLVEAGAVDALVVKPMMVGLRNAVEILAIGDRAGVPAIVTTSFETGIGTAVAIHLAGAMPKPRLACGLSTLGALAFDVAVAVPAVVGGVIVASEQPGLGVAIDDAALHRAATGPRQTVGTP